MRTRILFTSIAIFAVLCSFTANTGMSVSSSAFGNDGMIPSKYTCEGSEINPPIRITNVPAGAKSLALILHDPDAPLKGGFTHWVMWNMDVKGNIPEHFTGAEQGQNGAHRQGYIGMCPPSGTHHYLFKVYALDTKLQLDKNTDKAALEAAMQGHILSESLLTGLYKKVK